jgi:hypothetical protein
MANGQQSQQQTDPYAQYGGGVATAASPVDPYAKYGGASSAPAAAPVEQPSALDSFWKSTFLGKSGEVAGEVSDWAAKKAAANRAENEVAIAAGKEPPHSEAANSFLGMLSSYGKMEKGATEPKNLALAGGVIAANTNPFTAVPVDLALAAHGGYGVYKNAHAALEGNPEAAESALLSGSEALTGATGAAAQGRAAWTKVNPIENVKAALSRKLSPQEATTVRSASDSQPALNVTPQEVLTHASQNGVKLTPGQALEDPAATNVQKMGTSAMVGGKDLAVALRQQRYAFVDSVNKLGKTVDPNGVGVNDETAGHAIQKSVQDSLDSLKGKAAATYDQVAQQQQNLSGDIRGLTDFAKAKQTETITDPRTGQTSTRPVYQPPAVKTALDDIASKPAALGPNPSIASLRSLRTEFWDKGNDYTGNVPDAARAIYKQAASQVDDAIMNAAKGTPFEGTFRAANAQWKAIQSKYNEPGQPLYKILQQDDPTKITAQLQNAPASDILMLRQELSDGPAIQALRRSVVNDIANNKFTVRAGGLGGYSHEYLNALFGPDVTKQFYLKADLARRIGYDANPSGTGSAMSVLEQGGNIKSQPKLTTFAKLSMPRDPLSFLSQQSTASPASRTALPQPIVFPRSGKLSEMANLGSIGAAAGMAGPLRGGGEQ